MFHRIRQRILIISISHLITYSFCPRTGWLENWLKSLKERQNYSTGKINSSAETLTFWFSLEFTSCLHSTPIRLIYITIICDRTILSPFCWYGLGPKKDLIHPRPTSLWWTIRLPGPLHRHEIKTMEAPFCFGYPNGQVPGITEQTIHGRPRRSRYRPGTYFLTRGWQIEPSRAVAPWWQNSQITSTLRTLYPITGPPRGWKFGVVQPF